MPEGIFSRLIDAGALAADADVNQPVMAKTMEELVQRTSSIVINDDDPAPAPAATEPAVTAKPQVSDPYADARAFIEAVRGEPLKAPTMHKALKSGIVLCELANKLIPGCCKEPSYRKLPHIQMENIGQYLKASEQAFGVPGFQSFSAGNDGKTSAIANPTRARLMDGLTLHENKDMDAVVAQLHALGSVSQQRGLGPMSPTMGVVIGTKLAAAAHNAPPEGRLNAGTHAAGSSGLTSSIQAEGKAKPGLAPATKPTLRGWQPPLPTPKAALEAPPMPPEPPPRELPSPEPMPEAVPKPPPPVLRKGVSFAPAADREKRSSRVVSWEADGEAATQADTEGGAPKLQKLPSAWARVKSSDVIRLNPWVPHGASLVSELPDQLGGGADPHGRIRRMSRSAAPVRARMSKAELQAKIQEALVRASEALVRESAVRDSQILDRPSLQSCGSSSSFGIDGSARESFDGGFEATSLTTRVSAITTSRALARASMRESVAARKSSRVSKAARKSSRVSTAQARVSTAQTRMSNARISTRLSTRAPTPVARAPTPIARAAAESAAEDAGVQETTILEEEPSQKLRNSEASVQLRGSQPKAPPEAPLGTTTTKSEEEAAAATEEKDVDEEVGEEEEEREEEEGSDEAEDEFDEFDETAETEDAFEEEFTEADLQAVEDAIFLLRSRPSHKETYYILEQLSTSSSTWRTVFLLLNGLGALSRPLLGCATGGGLAGSMHGAPSEADVQLLGELLREVRSLMDELGMQVLIGSRADLAQLREEHGLAAEQQNVPWHRQQGSELEMLTALCVCVATLRDHPKIALQLGAGPLPVLLAVAFYSRSACEATTKAMATVAAIHGEAGRLSALVGVCDSTHIAAPPSAETDSPDASTPGGSLYLAWLSIVPISLAILNCLLASPKDLDERLSLREECLRLGLGAQLDGLEQVVAQHQAGSQAGRQATDEDEVVRQMATLRRQLELYAEDLSEDAEEEKHRLEYFRGMCVLLTTSVAVSKQVKEQCKTLETLLDSKGVGYTVIDGALPHRARMRNALWQVSGKAIGSSVLKKDYPQVFVDNKYIGGCETIEHLMESDTIMKTKVQRMAATVADGQVGFDETFGAFYGKPKIADKPRW